jgi:hypothetical protein
MNRATAPGFACVPRILRGQKQLPE